MTSMDQSPSWEANTHSLLMRHTVSNCDGPKLLKVYVLNTMCSNGYHSGITQFCAHEVWYFFTQTSNKRRKMISGPIFLTTIEMKT
jgi:hypothetical protein